MTMRDRKRQDRAETMRRNARRVEKYAVRALNVQGVTR